MTMTFLNKLGAICPQIPSISDVCNESDSITPNINMISMESVVDQKDKQCKYKSKAMTHSHLSPPQYIYSHPVLSYHAGEIRVNRI